MALNGLFCADVPLRNYSLTHFYLLIYNAPWWHNSSVLDLRSVDFRLVHCQVITTNLDV